MQHQQQPRFRLCSKIAAANVVAPAAAAAEGDESDGRDEDVAMEEEEAGEDTGDTEIVYCATCGQGSNDFEKDLLPDRQEVIMWHRSNYSRRLRKIKCGEECYHCWGTRRAEFDNISQSKLLKKIELHNRDRDSFDNERRARVRGEKRYGKCTATKSSIQESYGRKKTQYVESIFYFLDDYLQQVKAPQMRTLKEKAEYLLRTHGKKIVKDMQGNLGIEET